jgi:hypothetical protein
MDKLYASMRVGDLPDTDDYGPDITKPEPDQVLHVIVGLLELIITTATVEKSIRFNAALLQHHFYENADEYNIQEQKIFLYPNSKELIKFAINLYDTYYPNRYHRNWDELPNIRERVAN